MWGSVSGTTPARCARETWSFWVQGDYVAGVYGVGRIFAPPEWTVVRGDPDEDEYVARQIGWLKYSLIADQVTLKREEVEGNPAFGAFVFFTAPESGNLYPLTELQWRILFQSVARYCRRHADGAARTQARGKH